MLDAIGRTLVSVEQKLAAMPEDERLGLVSVTIITDGYENASDEYCREMIQKRSKKQRVKYSWVFSFIGANIDFEKTSGDLGIDRKMSKKFTASKAGVASVFAAITKGTTASVFGTFNPDVIRVLLREVERCHRVLLKNSSKSD